MACLQLHFQNPLLAAEQEEAGLTACVGDIRRAQDKDTGSCKSLGMVALRES